MKTDKHITNEGLTDRFKPPPTKVCTKCKKEKPIKDFAHSAKGKHGYSYECKTCKNEADKIRKQQRAEYAKNYFTF